MKPRVLLLALLCMGLLGGVAWWVRTPHRGAGAMTVLAPSVPPATVSAVRAMARSWQTRLRTNGDVRAVQGADLSAEVSGIVDSIAFSSGQDVAAGTLLLRLRPNDDDARLAQLRAVADLASANLARDRRQFDAQAISRASLDADESNLRADQARVTAQQAQMEEKIVRAPFAGKLGIRAVDVGQYLTAGTAIVTLQALAPIFVDFNVQQQALGGLSVGQKVDVSVDAWPRRVFPARIASIDSRVDPASRMLMVRAELANHDHALLPGMFAIVSAETGAAEMHVTIPQAAVSYNPYGDFVYVLVPGPQGGLVAQSRVIETGPVRGDQVAILSGIAAGEQVVTAGQLKLRQGSPVLLDNSVQPADAAMPSVQDE